MIVDMIEQRTPGVRRVLGGEFTADFTTPVRANSEALEPVED
jgi:hypothetical protein